MTDIDKHILTDIRAALSAIKEQIDVIDSRLERMTEICSGDADTLAEEPAAVLPVQAAEAAAVVVEEAFEDKVGVPAEEEALSGERENFFVGEEISLGGNLEMAFADSEPLENAEDLAEVTDAGAGIVAEAGSIADVIENETIEAGAVAEEAAEIEETGIGTEIDVTADSAEPMFAAQTDILDEPVVESEAPVEPTEQEIDIEVEMAAANPAFLENADAANGIGEEVTDAVEAVAEAVVEADEFAEAVGDATAEVTDTVVDDVAVAGVAAEVVENEVVVADEAGEEAVGAIGGEVAAEVEEFAEDVAVDADIIENEIVVAIEKPKEPVRFAWRTNRPGSPVRNILSAISLNDRMLFIRTLFADDPALFQKTISVFNSLSSLAEAEAYIRSHFPKWDMSSDTVYRFMMAARRRFS